MKSSSNLKSLLKNIDRKGYPAYKSTQGTYDFGTYFLSIDHVQGDPFASPSKLSIHVKGRSAGFPASFYDTKYKQVALCDHLTRLFYQTLSKISFRAKGSGKSGLFSVSKCGQQVLERTACTINPSNGDISVHFEAGFPANGRTVNARELDKMLFGLLPDCVSSSLFYKNIDQKMLESVIYLSEDQHTIRKKLSSMGLVAFIADGSVLPRESGISQKPLRNCVKFQSPDTYRVSFELPHQGMITGMGIPKGITLIVGGMITSMFKEAEDSILYRVKQDYPEPNRIGVFTKRKLEDWITRGLNIYKELEAENEVIQRMKAEYFALLKGEKIQWKDTVRHTEGTIRRNGFIFSFSIHGRNIREEIKLCVPNGKSDYTTFTKLADNRLSVATI